MGEGRREEEERERKCTTEGRERVPSWEGGTEERGKGEKGGKGGREGLRQSDVRISNTRGRKDQGIHQRDTSL